MLNDVKILQFYICLSSSIFITLKKTENNKELIIIHILQN